MKQVEYFRAIALKELKNKCADLGSQIIDHLVKCYVFPNATTVVHWVSEINKWVFDCSDTKSKGGKFQYHYIFDHYTPFDKSGLEARIHDMIKEESKLTPERTDWKQLKNYIMSYRSALESYSAGGRRKLEKSELTIIFQNNHNFYNLK